jgi:hypothetical protein
MADKYQTLQNGKGKLVEATVVSTGAGEAGDILALGTDGKIDESVLPVGVGPDVKIVEAFEDLGAGDYINIFDDGGTPKARLADNSNGREAHGWLKSAALTGANATVYFEGPNDAAPAGTTGQRAYLGTGGGVITTPLDPTVPANDGKLHQLLGTYVDNSTVNTDIDDCIIL